MAITDYLSLKKEVSDWVHMNGELDDKFDTFLQLCEVEIYSNPDEPLNMVSLDMVHTATLDTTSRFTPLPTGVSSQAKLTISIDDYNREVAFQTVGNIETQDAVSGIPCFFTVSNNQIEFDKKPDQAYDIKINYLSTDDPLTADNTTNVIIAKYPNIYLYGCLSQAFSYSQEDQQAAKYSQYFMQAIKYANKRERDIKFPDGLTIYAPRVV